MSNEVWATGFDAQKKAQSIQTGTLIASGCEIKGTLTLEGKVEIHGVVEGEICSHGELVIGESAQIEAQVRGREVTVFGAVRGDIECTERLELQGGASIIGDIKSPTLVIQEGVHFDGRCSMGAVHNPSSTASQNGVHEKIVMMPDSSSELVQVDRSEE